MKYVCLILILSIFSINKVMGEKVLFRYNKDYMGYSFDNLTVIYGDIKRASKLQKISSNLVTEKFPYDGVEIILTDNKKVYYIITKNKANPLPEKKLLYYTNQEKQSFFVDDYLAIGNERNLAKKYKLKQEEESIVKDLFYREIQLSDKDYGKLYEKVKNFDKKVKKYYKIQTIPVRRVEIFEITEKLGYVTEIDVLEDKIIYWSEEEEELQNNKIYIEVNEIKTEIEKYTQNSNNLTFNDGI